MSAPIPTAQILWKYPLELKFEPQTMHVPALARIAHIDWFQGRPTIWYLVEQQDVLTPRRFQVAATGQQMPGWDGAIYHGAVIQNDAFVWHIFELIGEPQSETRA